MVKRIPVEQLVILHNQLGAHLPRDSGRKALIEEFSTIFGVTPSTVYRQLRKWGFTAYPAQTGNEIY